MYGKCEQVFFESKHPHRNARVAWLRPWKAYPEHFRHTMWLCGSAPAAQGSVRGAGLLGEYDKNEGKSTQDVTGLFIEIPFPALCEKKMSSMVSTITTTATSPNKGSQ